MERAVFFPNKRQQPGNHDRHKKQHADHRQRKSDIIRKPDAILAIEEESGRQREPGDEADRSPINLRVKLIEYRPVMGGKFPTHENLLLAIWSAGLGARTSRSPHMRQAKPRGPCAGGAHAAQSHHCKGKTSSARLRFH
jgi:hypothetical protein